MYLLAVVKTVDLSKKENKNVAAYPEPDVVKDPDIRTEPPT